MKKIAFMLISLYMGLMGANAQSNKFDLNEDGHVNITDVTKLVTNILDQNNINGYDLNNDGDVNITDVILLVNYILGNNQEMPSLQLSTNSIYINGDYSSNQRLVKIISGSGSYTVTSSNNYVATAEIYPESYVTLTIKGLGETTITVYDEVSGKTATIQVDVRTLPHLVDDTRYLFLYVGQVKNVDISFGLSNKIGSGNYSVQNNVPSVAGVRIENGILIVTGISEGLDRFWVTDNNIKDEKGNPITQMYEVRVKQICPDSNHPHMIDLGLGTKWACCNVGASRPQEYGGYYAWGETEEKSVYNDITYQYSWGEDKNGDGYYDDIHYLGDDEWVYGLWQNLGDISGTGYDVAHMKWGGNWCMPSKDEIQGLIDNCTYEWTTLNGVNGGLFTGLSGNSIFIPDAGICRNADPYNAYYIGYTVWSSTPDSDYPGHAYLLWEDFEGNPVCDTNHRGWGISVRPVWKE